MHYEHVQVPLVGAVGQDYVHTVLSSMDPQNALREIQKRGAFKDRRCEPLLRLLDQLGAKRCAHAEGYSIGYNTVAGTFLEDIWQAAVILQARKPQCSK